MRGERRGADTFEMVDISPGRVELSDRRTQRRWPVEVARFRLSVLPVTQAQYAEVTGRSG
ncbi:hypothetical protein [Nocardia pseudobrasiliensis]|uniref:hypothetical protein n=1 Tax=Nocardia pseudobrasiliensis TaxID=45979 RepID=UPI00083149BB|nr:hypothetical protein [Nocardia pseudobrasiliensis]